MVTNKQRLETALAAIDQMTDAEYLALHEEAKKYASFDIVVPDLMPEPEMHLHLRTSVSAVNGWHESISNIHISNQATYAVDSEPLLVA